MRDRSRLRDAPLFVFPVSYVLTYVCISLREPVVLRDQSWNATTVPDSTSPREQTDADSLFK